jgi:outer membrane translocation and assembly module TamA
MALFMDAGKVTSRFTDLGWSNLKTSYGIGASIHTPLATILRMEYARSREGSGLILSFSPSF